MKNFKKGDIVLCVSPVPAEHLESKQYTVKGYQSDTLLELEEFGDRFAWFDDRFELVERGGVTPEIKEEEVSYIKFKVITWDEWTSNILKSIEEKINCGDMNLGDVLYSPFLSFQDPKPFCEHHMFNNIYENRVMVKHFIERDCYWYINSDETILIYKPELL